MVRFLLGLLGFFSIFFAIGASVYFGYRFGKWLLSNDCPYDYNSKSSTNPYRINNSDYTTIYSKPISNYS
jgi:hypothetical protein